MSAVIHAVFIEFEWMIGEKFVKIQITYDTPFFWILKTLHSEKLVYTMYIV